MAKITLFPEALRGSTETPTFNLPDSAPVHVQIAMTSPVYPTDSSLAFEVIVYRSPDGIQPFEQWFGSKTTGGGLGAPGKFGIPMDGLFRMTCSFEGVACVAKVGVIVNTPFVWGLTAEVVP